MDYKNINYYYNFDSKWAPSYCMFDAQKDAAKEGVVCYLISNVSCQFCHVSWKSRIDTLPKEEVANGKVWTLESEIAFQKVRFDRYNDLSLRMTQAAVL